MSVLLLYSAFSERHLFPNVFEKNLIQVSGILPDSTRTPRSLKLDHLYVPVQHGVLVNKRGLGYICMNCVATIAPLFVYHKISVKFLYNNNMVSARSLN